MLIPKSNQNNWKRINGWIINQNSKTWWLLRLPKFLLAKLCSNYKRYVICTSQNLGHPNTSSLLFLFPSIISLISFFFTIFFSLFSLWVSKGVYLPNGIKNISPIIMAMNQLDNFAFLVDHFNLVLGMLIVPYLFFFLVWSPISIYQEPILIRSSSFFFLVFSIILKIGSDRPVQPVELGTGQVSGPTTSKESLHLKTSIEPDKPAKPDWFYRLADFLFFFWKKK